MSPSGVPKFDVSSNDAWILHSDLDERIVLRQVADSGDWLFWGSSRSALSSDSRPTPSPHWQPVVIDEQLGLSSTVLLRRRRHNDSDEYDFAVQLKDLSLVADLIERWGAPPIELQTDWSAQLAEKNSVSGDDPPTWRWEYLLATDDGKLVTFDELERLSSVVEPTSPEFCAEATDFPPLGQIAPLARKSASIALPLGYISNRKSQVWI